jgi:hypothetical protein
MVNRNAYRVLMGKPEGKRGIGNPICKWEDNIKMGFKNEIGLLPLNLSGSGNKHLPDPCERGYETSGGEF